MNSVLSPQGYPCALPGRGPAPGPPRPQRDAGRRLRSPKGEGGYTLVELITVIAIITLLSGMVVGGVLYAGRKAGNAATKGLLERLSIAINMYHADYGAYPPDRRPASGWSGWYMDDRSDRNNLNMPSETLLYFLAGIYQEPREDDPNTVINDEEFQAMARKTTYMDFRDSEVRRVGVEFWMSSLKNVPDPDDDDDDFPEIVDVWGSPIHYVAIDAPNPPKPNINKESFDLASRGRDKLTGSPYEDRDAKVNGIYTNRDNITNFPME